MPPWLPAPPRLADWLVAEVDLLLLELLGCWLLEGEGEGMVGGSCKMADDV